MCLYFLNNMKPNNKWNELTMQQKADLMRLYVANGYTNLNKIKEHYLGTPYKSTNDSDYDYYNAHTDNMPKEKGEHYSSRNPRTGEILKSESHPTRYLTDRGEAQAGMTMYKNKLNGRTFTTESDLGDLYGYDKVPIKSYVDNPEELALRVEWAESKGDPNAVSNKGAVGLNQITEVVHNDYIAETGDIGDLRDPSYNRKIRDWHLNKLNRSRTINNNNPSEEVKLAKQYGAYNYGQGKLGKALEKAKNEGIDIYNTLDWVDTKYIPKETVDYINFVVRGLDSTEKGSHRTEDHFSDYYINNKSKKFDEGGPLEEDLYYSNIEPLEVTTSKRKVNIPEDPLSKEGRKQAQFYLNRIKSGDMTFEGVPESYKKVVNNYITGDKLVHKSRENSQYKGLNQMMQNLILGGPTGLILDTAFKGVGSIYNGYNVFDPEHPGLFTKEYSDKHPYLTTAVNMAASLPFGAWDTYLSSNMDDFNDLSSVNRRSPGGNRPTIKQAQRQIDDIENQIEDLKSKEQHIQSDAYHNYMLDQIAKEKYGKTYQELNTETQNKLNALHMTRRSLRDRDLNLRLPIMQFSFKQEELPLLQVLALHNKLSETPQSAYGMLGTSYAKDGIGDLSIWKDTEGKVHISNKRITEDIDSGLTTIDEESGITIPRTLLTKAGKTGTKGTITKKGKNYRFTYDNTGLEYKDSPYVELPKEIVGNIRKRQLQTVEAIDKGQGLLPEGSYVIYGSSILADKNYLPHVADDVDFIVTREQAEKLKSNHKWGNRDAPDGFKLFTGNKKLDGPKGIDITYINRDSNTGLAKGIIAKQLFYKQFPEEYWKQARNEAMGGTFTITKTPEQLLESFDWTVDTMLDTFIGKNKKFANRVPVLMEQADVADLQKTLHRKGRMFFGERYKPIMRNLNSETPLVNTFNTEDNLRALELMGYTGVNLNKLAKDPQRMQLVLEDFYQIMTGLGRGVSDVEGDVIFDALSQHIQGGGNARGAGLNNVRLGNSRRGELYGINQIDLSSYVANKSASEVVDFFNMLTDSNTELPKDIVDQLNEVLPKGLKLSDRATTGEFNNRMKEVYYLSKKDFDAVQKAIQSKEKFPIPYIGTEEIDSYDSYVGSIIPLTEKEKLNVFNNTSKSTGAYNAYDLDFEYLKSSRQRVTEGLASTKVPAWDITDAHIYRTRNDLRGMQGKRTENLDYLDRKKAKIKELFDKKVEDVENTKREVISETSDYIKDRRRDLHKIYKNKKSELNFLKSYKHNKEREYDNILTALSISLMSIFAIGSISHVGNKMMEKQLKKYSQTFKSDHIEFLQKESDRDNIMEEYQQKNSQNYYK